LGHKRVEKKGEKSEEMGTYSTPFFRVRSSEPTRTLEVFLVHGHVLVFPGLVSFALRQLFRQRLFLIDHRRPYPNERILVPTLHMEHVLHFSEGGQRP
jgi:hypothetical protein